MDSHWRISRNKIPRSRRTLLPRPRVMNYLSEVTDFPFSVVKAGAGYGKTTAVSRFADQSGLPVHWLTITDEERDPAGFVASVLGTMLPKDVPEAEVQRIIDGSYHPLTWTESAKWAVELVTTYVHEECLMVLDDFHVLDEDASILAWLDQWIQLIPVHIHVLFVSRTQPTLPYLQSLHLRGDVLLIRERELAFTEEEISFLFNHGVVDYRSQLDVQQIQWLRARTTGMAMVLSMLWREWRDQQSFSALQVALDEGTSVRDQVGQLFMTGLSEQHASFFQRTAVLINLSGPLCDFVLERSDSTQVLRSCERKGYVSAEPDGVTYVLHPLVRDYLLSMLSPAEYEHFLWRAIQWYVNEGQTVRAIGYLFLLPDQQVIARELLTYIPEYLARGQVSTVQGWLDRLRPAVIETTPGLLYAKAEVARITNRFAQALEGYEEASLVAERQLAVQMVLQTHIGRSRLYLDTIQPSLAERHIRQARQFVDRSNRTMRAAIVQLAFENAINLGRLVRARRLQRVLTQIEGGAVPANNSDVRVLLRTGQLMDAIVLLKARVSGDELDNRTALSHREATLLLSLIYAMTGEGEAAQEQALRGYSVGDFLHAPFVRAVGYIRLGHARHILNPLSNDSLKAYQQAIQLMDEMDVPRGKSEALLGLCFAYGYRRQLALSRACAEQGIHIAQTVGDVWMAGLVRIAFAQVCCTNGLYQEALEYLNICEVDFRQCDDVFLWSATLLWRAFAWKGLADKRMHEDLTTAIQMAKEHGHEWLFLRPTLFGVKDPQIVVPLLQTHRQSGHDETWVMQWLHQLDVDVDKLPYHPGYTLRIQTLGSFKVWRGFDEVPRKAWQREKSRQLFQYFLTHRGVPLHREEITEQLWGDVSPESAERDFKVALNGLSAVIEPDKPGRGTTLYIQRNGLAYELIAHDMLVVDRDEFLARVQRAQRASTGEEKRALLKFALGLYRGDYLPDARYDTWSQSERERLRAVFIKAALEYADLCMKERMYVDVIETCEKILDVEPTWEDAYVSLMKAYGGLYNRPMVLQTYKNCKLALEREYGIDVLESTKQVYMELLGEAL